MTPTQRPEVRDEHGTQHRHACTRPGWLIEAARMRGWNILRCADCGVVRLARTADERGAR